MVIFKNSPYVETVRNLMNTYSTNNIKKIKKAYQEVSEDNLFFRDALNNMDAENPLGKKMNLDKENEIFNTQNLILKSLGTQTI